MKYLAAFIIPLFIMSCALEKEQSDSVSSVLQFTTASINIDSIDNYTSAPACMDFSNGSSTITYTVKSEGHYGPVESVDSDFVRKSYFQINRARLYFNGISIDILPSPNTVNVYYNQSYTQEQKITKEMLNAVGITDGTSGLSIEIVVSEYEGRNGNHTALNELVLSTFGQVTVTSDGTGCQ